MVSWSIYVKVQLQSTNALLVNNPIRQRYARYIIPNLRLDTIKTNSEIFKFLQINACYSLVIVYRRFSQPPSDRNMKAVRIVIILSVRLLLPSSTGTSLNCLFV